MHFIFCSQYLIGTIISEHLNAMCNMQVHVQQNKRLRLVADNENSLVKNSLHDPRNNRDRDPNRFFTQMQEHEAARPAGTYCCIFYRSRGR